MGVGGKEKGREVRKSEMLEEEEEEEEDVVVKQKIKKRSVYHYSCVYRLSEEEEGRVWLTGRQVYNSENVKNGAFELNIQPPTSRRNPLSSSLKSQRWQSLLLYAGHGQIWPEEFFSGSGRITSNPVKSDQITKVKLTHYTKLNQHT